MGENLEENKKESEKKQETLTTIWMLSDPHLSNVPKSMPGRGFQFLELIFMRNKDGVT